MRAFDGRIGHLEGIESPWANAGGVAKTVEEIEQMAKTGVGYVEDGSQTLPARLGNGWNPVTEMRDKKDWDYDPETGEMHNSLGMPGKGMDIVEREIPEKARIAHAYKKPLVVNVAPVSDKPAEESFELISRAYTAGADSVIVNAGCPNVYDENGKPHEVLSRSPNHFGHVLSYLAAFGLPKPIWIRISPQDSFSDMELLARQMEASGIVSAVLVPNTWMVPMPTKADGQPLLEVQTDRVGKSGPAMAKAAALQTSWVVYALRELNSKIDTISSSGIMDGRELQYRRAIGAVAGAGTTFYYASQDGWQEDTNHLLKDYADLVNGNS